MARTEAKRSAAIPDSKRANTQSIKNQVITKPTRDAYPTPTSADEDDLCSLQSDDSEEDELMSADEDESKVEGVESNVGGEVANIEDGQPIRRSNAGIDEEDQTKSEIKDITVEQQEDQLMFEQEDNGGEQDEGVKSEVEDTGVEEQDNLVSDAGDDGVEGTGPDCEAKDEDLEEDQLASEVEDDGSGDRPVSEPEDDIKEEDPSSPENPTEEDQSSPPLDPLEEKPTLLPILSKTSSKSTLNEKVTLYPHGLQPVETTIDNHWIYLFFRFCCERHKMYERRQAGIPREELTKDETMSKVHIGNVFRQLDPSSKNIRENIIGKGDQSATEVCFRLFLYCLFYSEDTWKELCNVATGGIPTWSNYLKDLPSFEAALYQKSIIEKKRIYYGGFQIVPPNVYFSNNRNKAKEMIHFAASLRLVLSMMLSGLPDQLLKCQYAVDVSYILQTIPTLGGFLSWNIICFLNDTTNFKWFYRNYATCGPGPRSYLSRIFGGNQQVINSIQMEESGLIWLYQNQYKYYSRLNEDPPHAWELGLKPGMRVLDIENALCWCHRYVNAFERKQLNNLSTKPKPKFNKDIVGLSSEPSWCVEEKWLKSTSKNIYKDDLEETSKKLEHIQDKEEDCYEVEKVITRKGSRGEKKKDPYFRVRWKGYTPEEDTWERASSIKQGAEESLNDWIEWENKVWECIEKVKKEYPFKKPATAKEENDTETSEITERPSKRPRRGKSPVKGEVIPTVSS